MVFKNLCILVLWTKVASLLKARLMPGEEGRKDLFFNYPQNRFLESFESSFTHMLLLVNVANAK